MRIAYHHPWQDWQLVTTRRVLQNFRHLYEVVYAELWVRTYWRMAQSRQCGRSSRQLRLLRVEVRTYLAGGLGLVL